MGLKLLTLAFCSLTGKKVKVHSTGKKAKVLVAHEKRNFSFQLLFDDGTIQIVSWSEDNQGYIVSGEELDEADEPVTA